MPPFLGQGASLALQGACALARRVHEHNAGVRSHQGGEADAPLPDLGARLREYERRRWLPTKSITAKTAFLGERPRRCGSGEPFSLHTSPLPLYTRLFGSWTLVISNFWLVNRVLTSMLSSIFSSRCADFDSFPFLSTPSFLLWTNWKRDP
ncbi:hypothetical protein ACHAWF_000843 [Thalassiosira exigua]